MTALTLDTPRTEDQRHSLRTVKSAGDNLLGLLNDLLDFSKIEAGKLELDRTPRRPPRRRARGRAPRRPISGAEQRRSVRCPGLRPRRGGDQRRWLGGIRCNQSSGWVS
jgi:His Kinase A (phospho-acceptor) domain